VTHTCAVPTAAETIARLLQLTIFFVFFYDRTLCR